MRLVTFYDIPKDTKQGDILDDALPIYNILTITAEKSTYFIQPVGASNNLKTNKEYTMLKHLTLISFSLLLINCDNPVTSDSPVSTSEQWKIVEPQTTNYADFTINKHENGSLSCTGNWYYKFFGNAITCKIMNGSVKKDSTYLQFNATGNASYSPDSAGYVESSPFSLMMKGNFKNGSASGDWAISFTDTVWNEWAPDGIFTGRRETGTGITD